MKGKCVILALGSNEEGEARILQALTLLKPMLEALRATSILCTAPIGDLTQSFHNCIATGYTTEDVDTLSALLKQAERRCGDRKSLRQQGKVLMDIDLLEYDGIRYHAKDWDRPYIQRLMREIGKDHNPIEK